MVARTGGGWTELIDGYRSALEQGLLEPYRKKRWSRCGEFSGWLAQERLPELTLDRAAAVFRASGGSRQRDFKANPIEEIRDTLDFLLYDEVKLEGRFDECVSQGGGFKLAGAGKEFVSYVLCLHEPALFGVWNSNAERMLRRTGSLNKYTKTGPLGIQYLDILEGLGKLRYQLRLADYMALDEFCYAASRVTTPG